MLRPQPDQLSRPVVTPHEGDLINALSNAVNDVEGKFWCGGSGSADVGVDKPVLFYLDKTSEDAEEISKHVKLGPSAQGYAALHEAAHPSSHGVGNQTVYDENYRLAREFPAGEFALNFDPLMQDNGIVGAIAAVCGTGVRLSLYKVNSYAEGGFFKAHKDTPKSEDHIGSVVIALPAPYEGGELVIQHEDKSITFDWASSSANGKLQWAFFFSDVTHEILPVKKGHRLTLAYDVYETNDKPAPTSSSIVIQTTPLSDVFAGVLSDPSFLPNGGRVAFGLQHGYPVKNDSYAKAYMRLLKGSDRLLHDVLLSFRLDPVLVAVYDLASENVFGWQEKERPLVPDHFTSWYWGKDSWGYASDRVLLTSDTFAGIDCDMQNENLDEYEELQRSANAHVDDELIWCARPGEGSFAALSPYVAYGNEATLSWSYATAALIATIPPVGERPSTT